MQMVLFSSILHTVKSKSGSRAQRPLSFALVDFHSFLCALALLVACQEEYADLFRGDWVCLLAWLRVWLELRPSRGSVDKRTSFLYLLDLRKSSLNLVLIEFLVKIHRLVLGVQQLPKILRNFNVASWLDPGGAFRLEGQAVNVREFSRVVPEDEISLRLCGGDSYL